MNGNGPGLIQTVNLLNKQNEGVLGRKEITVSQLACPEIGGGKAPTNPL